MLNNLEHFIRYIRCIVQGEVTEKVSVQGSGYLPDSETLSHIISVERDGKCYFDGWDYTLEQDRSGTGRGLYFITFKDEFEDYVIKYAVGDKKVYPDFPRADVSFPRVSVIQSNTSFNPAGHGNWNSSGIFKSIKKNSITIYVMNTKDGVFNADNIGYYGNNAIDTIIETILSNLMSIGSIPSSSAQSKCDRLVDRPFVFPFVNFNIRNISGIEYDAHYGIWSRSITVEGDIIE